MKLRTFVYCLFQAYLEEKLDNKQHELVYGLSHYWGSGKGWGRFIPVQNAAASVQDRLIESFGYSRCPSCTWSTHSVPHHFIESDWCREEDEKTETED